MTTPAPEYKAGAGERAVTRVAVRCGQASGDRGVGVVIATLPVAAALLLAGQAPALAADPAAAALAYVGLTIFW